MALAALTLISALPLTLLPHWADAQTTPVSSITAGVTLPGAIPPLVQTSTLQGPLPGTQPISLALPLRNPEALGHLLQGLYDANSPDSGHFHFYTTSYSEYEGLGSAWNLEGICAYVLP